MNPVLMDAIVDFALFLDLSGDEAIEPHIAIAQMEQLSQALRKLTADERAEFARYIQGKALAEQREAGFTIRVEKLLSFTKDYGLVE